MKTGFLKVWGVPVLLAVLSMVGLLAALIGDGPWDGLSWVALGIPVVVIGWFFAKRGKIAK